MQITICAKELIPDNARDFRQTQVARPTLRGVEQPIPSSKGLASAQMIASEDSFPGQTPVKAPGDKRRHTEAIPMRQPPPINMHVHIVPVRHENSHRTGGRASARAGLQPRTAGVTLIEMIAVVAIIGLIAAISFPALTAGLESIRLASATDSIAAFLNGGLNRAERRQQGIEITIVTAQNHLIMRSTEQGFVRELDLPEGVTIQRVHPMQPGAEENASRIFYVYPGGTIPRIGIEVANRRGARRIVRIDPMTGVPAIEVPQEPTE